MLKYQRCLCRLSQGDLSGKPFLRLMLQASKLPCYASKEVLREKLMYAITSGAGFEMS